MGPAAVCSQPVVAHALWRAPSCTPPLAIGGPAHAAGPRASNMPGQTPCHALPCRRLRLPCRTLLSRKYGCANISFTHDPYSVIASSNKASGQAGRGVGQGLAGWQQWWGWLGGLAFMLMHAPCAACHAACCRCLQPAWTAHSPRKVFCAGTLVPAPRPALQCAPSPRRHPALRPCRAATTPCATTTSTPTASCATSGATPGVSPRCPCHPSRTSSCRRQRTSRWGGLEWATAAAAGTSNPCHTHHALPPHSPTPVPTPRCASAHAGVARPPPSAPPNTTHPPTPTPCAGAAVGPARQRLPGAAAGPGAAHHRL